MIDILREAFSYCPETGEIRRKEKTRNTKAGCIAGGSSDGVVEFRCKKYSRARFAWMLHYGEWPARRIVTVNGDNRDLRIENLRLCGDGVYVARGSCEYRAIVEIFASEKIIYDKDTGEIRHTDTGESLEKETIMNGILYKVVSDGSVSISSHRLAWLMYYGKWPEGVIDHIDHDGTNNRISNLRDVTHADNLRNARMSKCNKTGVKGVHKNKVGSYVATIGSGETYRYLGSFKRIEDAAVARKNAEREMGYHENHGK